MSVIILTRVLSNLRFKGRTGTKLGEKNLPRRSRHTLCSLMNMRRRESLGLIIPLEAPQRNIIADDIFVRVDPILEQTLCANQPTSRLVIRSHYLAGRGGDGVGRCKVEWAVGIVTEPQVDGAGGELLCLGGNGGGRYCCGKGEQGDE